MGRLAVVWREMSSGALMASDIPDRHICSGLPTGWHWVHRAVSVVHWPVGSMTERYHGKAGELFSTVENYYYFRGKSMR